MRTKRFHSMVSLGLCLSLVSLVSPALARSGSGGSGSGGGSGGGITVTTTTLTMSSGGLLFNGGLPAGQATFSYSKDGSSKSLTIQLSDINLPDGDTVDVEIDQAWRVANWIAHSYIFLPVTIQQGSGSVSWSTANGDTVPFLLPTAGTTTIDIWGNYTVYPGTNEPASGVRVMGVTFGALTRG